MLFAAGLGTRLRPYTNDRPKALVEVLGVSLLERNLQTLHAAGFTRVVVNIHHFADLMSARLSSLNFPGMEILISDESELVLETGGGLKKASALFDPNASILVTNVDIISGIDLTTLWNQHHLFEGDATLCISGRTSSRYLLFDDSFRLAGWKHAGTGEIKLPRAVDPFQEWAFSGIQVLSPSFWLDCPLDGKFSIIDWYLLRAEKLHIQGFLHDHSNWFDVGSPEKLEIVEAYLRENE